jgi:hypothetical protein
VSMESEGEETGAGSPGAMRPNSRRSRASHISGSAAAYCWLFSGPHDRRNEGGGTRTHDLGIKRSSTPCKSRPCETPTDDGRETSLVEISSGVVRSSLPFSYSLGTVRSHPIPPLE